MATKRKGADVAASSVSSVHVKNNSSPFPFDETTRLLREMRINKDEDDIMNSLSVCFGLMSSFQTEKDKLLQTSKQIKQNLEDQIQHAREACREESDDLHRMKLHLKQLERNKEALQAEIKMMEAKQFLAKENIEKYKTDAQQETESIDTVEAERMSRVPRLKNQVSLYAKTTRIRWDYDQEHVLAGEIAIQETESMRRFSIDPREYSECQVANYLWGLMDGNSSLPVPSA